MVRNISVLGSTGSIGTQTLDVARHTDGVCVKALATNSNIELVYRQIEEFKPELVAVMDEDAGKLLSSMLYGGVKVVTGLDGVIEAATYGASDMIINAVVGDIGLEPTIRAIRAKKDIGLANKETLVTAGELVMQEAGENNISLIPIDSEHSAIFQCLRGNDISAVEKIYLTASGGPFRGKTTQELSQVTLAQALAHPNWVMGKKITVDSATMMNKGLEVIEAKWLFDLELSQIEVLVHPQSVIHSMVAFCDGAVMAQLGEPDMRVPIQYALSYPHRVSNSYPRLDFLLKNKLTFEEPDPVRFRCLALAYEAMALGGTMPAVLNAANEAAVDLFLRKKIGFLEIPYLIEEAMGAYTVKYEYSLEDVLEACAFGRRAVRRKYEKKD